MKKIWLAIGLLLVFAVVGFSGCSAKGATPSTVGVNINSVQQEGIWVNGKGEVSAAPDIAVLNLGIQSQEKTVAEAQTKAAEAMDKVMTALTDNGVAKKDIQTQYFNIQRVTRWDKDTNQEIPVGYQVSNIVTAKIRSLDKVGAIIDAVAAAGGDLTRIDNISFSIEDPSKYYGEARQKAMADAKTRAEQLAQLGGVNLGKPSYISESTQAPSSIIYPRYAEKDATPMPAIETPISPGEMKVIINVQLVYSIPE